MDYVDEKRIQSAFYHPVSKPKTRVGMTKIYPAAWKCALGVGNFHSGPVDFNYKLSCVFPCFMLFIYVLEGEKSKTKHSKFKWNPVATSNFTELLSAD